jgi:hypothetical protein
MRVRDEEWDGARRAAAAALAALTTVAAGGGAGAQETQLFWGDTHVHTSWSVDAYAVGDYLTGPDEAYRFARGVPVLHTRLGTRIRIDQPLDFMVVADHAERFRYQVNFRDGNPELEALTGFAAAQAMVAENPRLGMGPPPELPAPLLAAALSPEAKAYGWGLQVDAAERANEPGVFTTFAGWEWTRNEGGNLHRVVFTPDGPEVTKQFIPFSSDDGPEPQDLWNWLEETSARTGATFVAMPHNSNLSNGRMFGLETEDGRPIDAAYARQRARWEPVMEITQVKGTSEAHPALSPNDEFAGFEIHTDLLIGGQATPNEADYARYALLRGLGFEAELGVNPYKYGFIGSTDTHTGLSNVDESDFYGKTVRDSLPEERLNSSQDLYFHSWEMSASGRAAVWAEENTREAIAAAFQRREVYATSGPRIGLRVFAGFGFRTRDAEADNLPAVGYSRGVPMGADLTAAPRGRALRLLIHAVKDPMGANLDRVQVVKGWVDASGETHERIFDAAWSNAREPNASGRLPAVGSTVDLATARYENTIGAAQLAVVWEDPEFDPAVRAFYYVRALEIPTPRHSLYDAVALGVDPAVTAQPTTIQERAWSSPVWYTPAE